MSNHLTDRVRSLLGDHAPLANRYAAVSVLNIAIHQSLLRVAHAGWGWGGGWANLFAASVGAVPAYLLSRAWVWKKIGEHSWKREVLPFWIIALIGLVVSTVAAEAADRTFESAWAVQLASLFGYGMVWVAKFFILGRLFADKSEEMAI